MAPMTRSRAGEGLRATQSMARYYAQRASAGLIVSEAINISSDAVGSPGTPGLFDAEQVDSWREVTSDAHDMGGHIIAQLWHTGRVGHSIERDGTLPVAPSAIAIEGQQHFTHEGMKDYETPRALTTDEVSAAVLDYGRATRNALAAGFDGVELHAAFGYLPNQFLAASANRRTDRYGGSIPNRCRFVTEALDEMIAAAGSDRVGIKLSPSSPYNGIDDPDPRSLYTHLIGELNARDLLYVHLMQPMLALDDYPAWPGDTLEAFGSMIQAPVIANAGYDGASARKAISSGGADMVSFARHFVANPDLPRRFRDGLPLSEPDAKTLYGGGDEGYIDYPDVDGRLEPWTTDPTATVAP